MRVDPACPKEPSLPDCPPGLLELLKSGVPATGPLSEDELLVSGVEIFELLDELPACPLPGIVMKFDDDEDSFPLFNVLLELASA